MRTLQLSRTNGRPCIVRRRRGRLSCRYPGGSIVTDGLAAPDTLECAVREIFCFAYTPQPGDVVVDAGAGKGTELLPFMRLVGPSGMVIAIEAHPEMFRQLRELAELNRLRNASLVEAALSGEEGRHCTISDQEEPLLNTVVGSSGEGFRVRTETLDGILRRLGVERVDFLKMNIEGAEVAALEGFREGIRRTRNVAISCHDFLADDGRGSEEMRTRERVRAYLEAAGFEITTRSHPKPWMASYLFGTRR